MTETTETYAQILYHTTACGHNPDKLTPIKGPERSSCIPLQERVADPPWHFRNYSKKGELKNPVAHYE